MAYYHDLVTRKSWEELQKLRHLLPFVLIGGWAAYLYTKALTSKDIDVLVDFDALTSLAEHYALVKNDRLKKYEAVREEVEIDIYLPHYSELGIPIEELREHTRSLEGFTVIAPEYLLALKFYTLTQRGRTPKGEKDFLDALALLQEGCAKMQAAREILVAHGHADAPRVFLALLSERTAVPELGLNAHAFAKLRRSIAA